MAHQVSDKEIQQYRDLVEVPDHFEDGFGLKMVVGTLFMAFLMVPASLYLSLFIGQTMGPAAKWVTVILFAEVAKRSMKSLKQQEIFLLFYMTGLVLINPFRLPLWVQYYVQSPGAVGLGVAPEVPTWVAPSGEVLEATGRTFMISEWALPLAVMAWSVIIERMDSFGLGYALYRLTAHIEKLPFPMAPVGALGITALAQERETGEQWRWRCFSLGAVMGLMFGFVYIGLPALTNTLFGKTVTIIPIPWLDLGPALSTKDFMPAVPINIVFDFGMILLGMVLPFWAVVGGVIGLLLTWALNPFLYRSGILSSWEPGMNVVDTLYNNTVDFYLSFSIGISLAIFVASVVPLVIGLIRPKKEEGDATIHDDDSDARKGFFARFKHGMFGRDKHRGDLSIFTALMIYLASVALYIGLCMWLMPGDPVTGHGRFPWMFFLGVALIYQPIIGYVNAKLEGMVGQNVPLPMVREAVFILSGFKGAGIWFAPIPISDHSKVVQHFRVMELVGVKVWGVIKTELLAVPVVIICMILFSELIFRLAPIPSEAYPYTQEVWNLLAMNNALMVTSTLEGSSEFMNALDGSYVAWGFGIALGAFALLTYLNLPVFLVYGAVRGLNQTQPGGVWLELVGALIGRYYLEKKLGTQRYKKYVSVIFAGFSAGVGLVGMGSVAIALIIKSTTTIGY